MAKTAAERQADFRARGIDTGQSTDGDRRPEHMD